MPSPVLLHKNVRIVVWMDRATGEFINEAPSRSGVQYSNIYSAVYKFNIISGQPLFMDVFRFRCILLQYL